MKRLLVLALMVASIALASAEDREVHQPKLIPQQSGTTQALIAVSPVNSRVVWASGAGGTYVVTNNGGKTWKAGVVPGAENLQFRDVQGINEKVAYLLSIGDNPGDFRIYKTVDGGATWNIEFQNGLAGAFYDCFGFWTPRRGIAHSDSVTGVFPDLRTTNGMTWASIGANMPPALMGEASFAASGTCVATQGGRNAWIATGGATVARVLATRDGGDTWNAFDTPLVSSPSGGAISVAFRDPWNGMVAGGDLASNDLADAARSDDGGRTWTLTNKPPVPGSIFCLAYARGVSRGVPEEADDEHNRTVVVTSEEAPTFDAGAAAWSPDEGRTWFQLPDVSGYWAVAFANPKAGWFVGKQGKILKISF
jgi:photosystem II stability/assembly factor-like uncharacterized protein